MVIFSADETDTVFSGVFMRMRKRFSPEMLDGSECVFEPARWPSLYFGQSDVNTSPHEV